jgi:hypothetical protein
MNLSPHFTLAELTITEHREIENIPDSAAIENLKRIAALLESVRSIVRQPVIVTSGFRCMQLNNAIGSKRTSQHILGCAADFRVPGMTPDQVCRELLKSDLAFDQLIREFDSWTHISVPNVPTGKPRKQALIIDRQGTRPFV